MVTNMKLANVLLDNSAVVMIKKWLKFKSDTS